MDIVSQLLASLKRYATKKPPEAWAHVRIDPDALQPIGQIIVYWSMLDNLVGLIGKTLSADHAGQLTREPPKRSEFKYRLKHLVDVIGDRYSARPEVISEFAKLQGRINKAKIVRDDVAHGQILGAEPFIPGKVKIISQGIERTYSIHDLATTASEISQLAGRLIDFPMWASYPEVRASLEQFSAGA